jgi:hypothetical protein
MQHHHSSVNAAEQREAVAKVIRLFAPKPAPGGEDGGREHRQVGRIRKKPARGFL